MRYEPFLYDEETEGVVYVHDPKAEGVIRIPSNCTDVEKAQNQGQVNLMGGLISMISELFESSNLCLDTTADYHSLFLRESGDEEFEIGLNSPKLSRKKLAAAEPHEVAGAVIDMVRSRETWTERISYKRFRMEDY